MQLIFSRFWIVAFFAFCGSAGAEDAAPNTGQVSEKTIQQLQTLEQAKEQRTPVEKKMSSNLLNAVRESQHVPIAAALPSVRPQAVPPQPEDRVFVTVKGQITPELQEFITSRGGTGIAALPEEKVLSAQLPLSQVEGVAARPEVKSLDFAAKATKNQARGVQDPEGDFAHAAAAARTQYNTSGAGVKVCVLSDSVTFLDQAKTNGSLGDVKVLGDQSGIGLPDVEGEGTAMLEIVHRIAPDAALEFATAYPTEPQMALNIDGLRQDGCNIIVDDITYFDESPFQDGPIGRAVARASNAGILYFSSAANSGNQKHNTSGTWEGTSSLVRLHIVSAGRFTRSTSSPQGLFTIR